MHVYSDIHLHRHVHAGPQGHRCRRGSYEHSLDFKQLISDDILVTIVLCEHPYHQHAYTPLLV